MLICHLNLPREWYCKLKFIKGHITSTTDHSSNSIFFRENKSTFHVNQFLNAAFYFIYFILFLHRALKVKSYGQKRVSAALNPSIALDKWVSGKFFLMYQSCNCGLWGSRQDGEGVSGAEVL